MGKVIENMRVETRRMKNRRDDGTPFFTLGGLVMVLGKLPARRRILWDMVFLS